MPRIQRTPRKLPVVPEIPFASAIEAWFWYVRAERLRFAGAKLGGPTPSFQRPCEPDDINRAVMGLYRGGALTKEHLKILATFGWADRVPDPRVGAETRPAKLWDEALDKLHVILKAKGIVE
ncbi:MAG: hypothetical protein OEY84_01520 [Rhodospirillaceae bacterium]|nr:hypothetical protein [Rhodospirillaceae bacterium]